MTHNQIDYWNLVENMRHNRALENLTARDVDTRAGTLAESTRHNIAAEGLTAAQIEQQDIASLRSTETQRYASELGYSASKYASELSAATQRYAANLSAETSRYNADLAADTQRYSSENQRLTAIYSADKQSENVAKQVEATERGQNLSALTSLTLKQFDAARDWYNQNTDLSKYLGRVNVSLGGE